MLNQSDRLRTTLILALFLTACASAVVWGDCTEGYPLSREYWSMHTYGFFEDYVNEPCGANRRNPTCDNSYCPSSVTVAAIIGYNGGCEPVELDLSDTGSDIVDPVHYTWTPTGPDSSKLILSLSELRSQLTWQFIGDNPAGLENWDIGYLDVSCMIDDEGACYNDGTLTLEGTAAIPEGYQDKVPLSGDFTVQLIDGEKGDAVGPRAKSLKVCPGSWVRLRISGIEDVDYRCVKGVDIHPGTWEITVQSSTSGTLSYVKPGPTEYVKDVQVTQSTSFSCMIGDVMEYNAGIPMGEYCDTTFTDSVYVEVIPLECNLPETEDWISTGGCASCGGSGGGGSIRFDIRRGVAEGTITIPEDPDGATLRICGTNAVVGTECGCEWFTNQGGGWTPRSGSKTTLQTGTKPDGTKTAIVMFEDGTQYIFEIADETLGIYYLVQKIDPFGATTTLDRDPDTGSITSVTLPDGKSYEYTHTDGRFAPSDVTYPDGKKHLSVEYANITDYPSGMLGESPTKVTILDPGNAANKSETTYAYYPDTGKIRSSTTNSGIKAEVAYDAYGKLRWVWTLNESEGKLYSQTKYTCGTTATLAYDGLDYDATTIREYYNANGVTFQRDANGKIIPVAEDNQKDRVQTRYYYPAGFVRAVESKAGAVRTSLSVYDVNTTSGSALYGKTTSAKQMNPASPATEISRTDYFYYNPDQTYAIPHDGGGQDDQYYISGGVVTYGTGSDVAGNGEVMIERVAAGSTGYTTEYRYLVRPSGTGLVMTPFVTITKDGEGRISKSVLNEADGSVREVYQENDQGDLQLVESYEYFTSVTNPSEPALWGQVKKETVKNVASAGTNRDMITDYTYAWAAGAETVTSTTGVRRQVSHYNTLGQLDWDQDECSRRTDHQYDWQGRLTVTTFPAVGGVRKTTENSYDCCHLEWTKDEEDHKTFYSYDNMGEVDEMRTDVQVSEGEYNLVSYTYTGPFGARDTVTTYVKNGGTVTPRTTTYTYDNQGRVERVHYPAGDADQGPVYDEWFQYDDLGRLVAKLVGLLDGSQHVLDGGKVTAYVYDDLSRVEKVSYDYYAGKQLSERLWPLVGIAIPSPDVSYVYDGATSRVSTVSTKREMLGESSGDAYRDAGYSYDSLGRIKTYTPAVPSGYGSIEYTWNNLSQKTSVKIPLGVGNLARLVEYSYDNTGRQVGMNVKADTATTSTGTPASDPGATTRFAYDADQNRVRLVNKAGDVYQFVYDPTASIPAVVYEQGPTYRYVNVREPDGGLVSRERWNGQGTRDASYTYHFDGLGSTRAITNESGVVTDTYEYDAWGNATHTSGTTADNPYLYVGQYGYYTHYQEPSMNPLDEAVGKKLLQLGVRYYDPWLGRFTQKDSRPNIGISPYSYGGNRPLLLGDPRGTVPTPSGCGKKTDPSRKKIDYAIRRICGAIRSGKMNKCGGCSSESKKRSCLKDFCSKGKITCDGPSCKTHRDWCGYADGAEPGFYHPEGTVVICLMNGAEGSPCDGCKLGQPLHETILHELMHLCGNDSDDDTSGHSAENQACDCIKKALIK